MSLTMALCPLLSTGSTQENRKTSLHDLKIADLGIKHQHKLITLNSSLNGKVWYLLKGCC